ILEERTTPLLSQEGSCAACRSALWNHPPSHDVGCASRSRCPPDSGRRFSPFRVPFTLYFHIPITLPSRGPLARHCGHARTTPQSVSRDLPLAPPSPALRVAPAPAANHPPSSLRREIPAYRTALSLRLHQAP